jgi:PncC family amidohydrolase
MAQGALEFSLADTALSVTGIAGPDGGSAEKPVGLVYFGLATRNGLLMHYKCQFTGNRDDVRMQSIYEGLRLLLSIID